MIHQSISWVGVIFLTPTTLHGSPVHTDGSEREDRHIHGDRLDQINQVAHEASEDPTARVEGVGQREGHARGAHQHVGEGQVADEEISCVVHLAGAADDVEEQVVAEDADQDNQGVAGNDERLEGLQQFHPHKLGAACGGAVLERQLNHLAAVGLHHATRAGRDGVRGPNAAGALHVQGSDGCSLGGSWRDGKHGYYRRFALVVMLYVILHMIFLDKTHAKFLPSLFTSICLLLVSSLLSIQRHIQI